MEICSFNEFSKSECIFVHTENILAMYENLYIHSHILSALHNQIETFYVHFLYHNVKNNNIPL